MHLNQILEKQKITPHLFGKSDCEWLAQTYHENEATVLEAARELSPEQFLRLFVTAHGMAPMGAWQTHTYARLTDTFSSKDHFFLIPIPHLANPRSLAANSPKQKKQPRIQWVEGKLNIDHLVTEIRPQSIPHTTPFWYFHYDPNKEEQPYHSMTLNLKPACPEKCTLCAGAKTGRVNNGMEGALETNSVLDRILIQHPESFEQLESVAIVTGCFDSFESLVLHLKEVRRASLKFSKARDFRVLEHNVNTPEQFKVVVGELGFDVFVTLECFDNDLRALALNGKVGRKGRDRLEFLKMIQTYAEYLEANPELEKKYVRVTYLAGIDSLETIESLFLWMANLNRGLKNVIVIPWLSIFTTYDESMRIIQNPNFSLGFLFTVQKLALKYFPKEALICESGSTAQGYARGLF